MVDSATSSSWTAFRSGGFRAIWFAAAISGTCAAAQATAATWAISQLSQSTLLLSLTSTFASLPLFFFTLPAGALADMVNRVKLVRITHVWLAAAAGGLAILGWSHLLRGNLVLFFVFLIGTGFAFSAPAFSSLLTDFVSSQELQSASVLNGLQLNLADIVGPALAGALIPVMGPNGIFAMTSLCFLLVTLSLSRCRPPKGRPDSVMEDFFQACATAVHYVRYAPGVQVILARQVLFSGLVAAIPALLPVIALKELHMDAANLGLVYTSMGVGAVITACFLLPWGRVRYAPNALTRLAAYLLVLVIFLMAFVHQTQLFLIVAGFAGVAWTSAANELWLAGQRAMPGWARGRMNAMVIMFSEGAMALGGIIYGATAQIFGVTAVLVAVAVSILLLLLAFRLLSSPLSIDFTENLSFEPAALTLSPQDFIHVPQPKDGPVLITIDFEVDETRGRELDSFINELRLLHLRNGAYSWQLYADPARPTHFHVQIMMPSWSQYLLQLERTTKTEQKTIDRAFDLHLGRNPPDLRTYIRVNKTFHEGSETR